MALVKPEDPLRDPLSTLPGVERHKEEAPPPEKLYPQDDINAFANGVAMDLRVRLAIEFLKAPSFQGNAYEVGSQKVAEYALDLADELLTQADAKGWLTPLGDGKLTDVEKNQARRLGAFNIYQQLGSNAAAQEEQQRVVPVAPQIDRSKH